MFAVIGTTPRLKLGCIVHLFPRARILRRVSTPRAVSQRRVPLGESLVPEIRCLSDPLVSVTFAGVLLQKVDVGRGEGAEEALGLGRGARADLAAHPDELPADHLLPDCGLAVFAEEAFVFLEKPFRLGLVRTSPYQGRG